MNRQYAFGPWLKQRRKALDLTQNALAQQVGCTVTTIRRIEAGTRRPSRQIAERLLPVLAIAPEDQLAMVGFARGTLPDPSPHRSTHPPMPASRLIGRAEQLTLIQHQFLRGDVRLLTLTGPPGIGKTRLGLEVTAQLTTAFADGVYFVDLAPIRDPALVTAAIAQVLGVKEISTQTLLVSLTAYLRDHELLLVLDNFEQVLSAAPQISDLLRASPWLKILVTSRAALRLRSERQFPVPPLMLPNPAQLNDIEALAQSPAVALFIERAQAVQPTFVLTTANAAAVAAICARLDGLPLAIELAAARIGLFPAEALLARLDRRLALLTAGARDLPERQQTLRAAIDWSYHLLDEREQQLFAWLAVFVGGWTLEAAEAICQAASAGAINTLDGVSTLLGHNLLRQQEAAADRPRFTMLETIREFALEQLELSGMTETIQRAHADLYLVLAEAAALQVGGEDQKLWLRQLETEYPNLRAALVWSRTKADDTTQLRLVLALNGFWRQNSYLSEARGWLADALTSRAGAVSRSDTVPSQSLRAKALSQLGDLAAWQNDLVAAQPPLEESLALFRGLGDTGNIADTLAGLGMVVLLRGDYARGGALLEESLSLFRQIDDSGGIAGCFFFIGTLAYVQGNLRQADELWQEGLTIYRSFGQTWFLTSFLLHLGIVALDQNEYERAGPYVMESLTLLYELGERWQIILALEACAGLAAAQAHQRADAELIGRQAARLFGVAEALRETLGAPLLLMYQAHYQRGVAAAHALLDDATFAAAWAAGRALSLDQAVTEALNR